MHEGGRVPAVAPEKGSGDAEFARLAGQRWGGFVEPLRDALDAEAADDEARTQRLTVRFTEAALVKVARLMPQPAPQFEPMSTLVGGGDLTLRIERLLDEPPCGPHRMSRARLTGATAAVLMVALVSYGPLLRAIHEATELLVNGLP